MQNSITPKLLSYIKHQFPALINLVNLWAYEDNALIGLDLQFSLCYELTSPDLTLQSEEVQEQCLSSLRAVMHGLPDNIVIQFWQKVSIGDGAKIKKYLADTPIDNDLSKAVIEAKLRHLRSSSIKNKKTYMFITTQNAAKQTKFTAFSLFSIIFAKAAEISESDHKIRIAQLRERALSFTDGLKGLGIKCRELVEEEVVNLLYTHLNQGRSDVMPCRKISSALTLREQLLYNAIENKFDYMYSDGFYYRSINLIFRPETINFDDVVALSNALIPDCDLSISINTANQEKLQKSLQTKANIMTGIKTTTFFAINHIAHAKSNDLHEIIEDVNVSSQKFFEFTLSITLKDRDIERLTEKTNKTLLAVRNLGDAEGIIDDLNHTPLFLSALPNHTQLNQRKHIFQSNAAVRLLPFSAEWTGATAPHMLFQTEDNQLIYFNPFESSLPAFNGLVIGQSGGGKSFLTNFILTNFYIKSPKNHIVIIDVGGSYRKLCGLFGGSYLEVTFSEEFAFNMFPDKKSAMINETDIDPDIITNISLIIRRMLVIENYSNDEQRIVNEAIRNVYQFIEDGKEPILSSLVYQLEAIAKDSDREPEDREISKKFSRSLKLYTEGEYAKLLDRPSKIDLKNRVLVFDLQKLGEDKKIQSIIFFVIQMAMTAKMKDLSLQKLFIMDEAWRFMDDDTGAELVTNLYRTSRKFNAGIYTISQNPADFLKSKASGGIMSNISITWILSIKTGHELLKNFNLTNKEIDKVANLTASKGKYSQVFLKCNTNSRVIRVEPSPLDYWICTTDANDTLQEDKVRQEHPEFSEIQILQELAKQRG
jgi:conjugal transfer ATP-binding protein TraC